MKGFEHQNIWIIGASSGIGKDLAIALSKENANLILSARRKDALEQLQTTLGKQHMIAPLDIANKDQVCEVIQDIFQKIKKLDRVLFMAGIYQPSLIEEMDPEFCKKLMEVNFMGAIYLTHFLLPLLKKQTSSQLVFCSSVAGYLGLSGGQPYSASKAALINFVESLYVEVKEYNIDIKLINPGFVSTPMTSKNEFQMPMIINSESAAIEIIKGLQKKAFEIHFPKRFTTFLKLLRILPYSIMLWITNLNTFKKNTES